MGYALFETFSLMLEWAIRERSGLVSTACYLDDFLFVGKAGSAQCKVLLHHFIKLSQEFRVLLAKDKTEEPSIWLAFLGIELDPVAASGQLLAGKLETFREKLQAYIEAKKLLLCELHSLVGHFACRVVALERAFTCQLCAAMAGLKSLITG